MIPKPSLQLCSSQLTHFIRSIYLLRTLAA